MSIVSNEPGRRRKGASNTRFPKKFSANQTYATYVLKGAIVNFNTYSLSKVDIHRY